MTYVEEKARELTIDVNMDTLQLSVDRQGATSSRIADQGTQHARRPKAYVAAEPVKEVVVEERSQVVMVKEQPCQLVRCLQCSGSHSHMFYCDQFIRSSPNERFQLVKEPSHVLSVSS